MTKIAYIDAFSGLSGDKFLGALVDAGVPLETIQYELKKLRIDGYRIEAKSVIKGVIACTKVNVIIQGGHEDNHDHAHPHELPHEYPHRSYASIKQMIEESDLSPRVKTCSLAIFLNLAKAEAKIHGSEVDAVHFHEVGAVDAIVDIVGTCIGFDTLEIDVIHSSPIALGSGFVNSDHGKIPVPAPATLELLKNTPVQQTDIQNELTTPTGAAIISTLAEQFGPMPPMTYDHVAYGAGTRDLEIPNALRIILGEIQPQHATESMDLIEANIDDASPEMYDYFLEKLLEEGACDAYFTPIQMKKGRQAIKLSVLSPPDKTQELINWLFNETTTIGLRIIETKKVMLDRKTEEIKTEWGMVRVKIARSHGRIVNAKPEYEDCKRIAKEHEIPLKQVYQVIQKLI